jgi:hypothetical protein
VPSTPVRAGAGPGTRRPWSICECLIGFTGAGAGGAQKLLQDAERKRVAEWRAEQKAEIDAVWKDVDVDGSGPPSPLTPRALLTHPPSDRGPAVGSPARTDRRPGPR